MNMTTRSKRRIRQRGALLIEVTMGFGALLVVALLLLKAAVTVTTVQKWTIVQALSDSRLSQEVALAKRIPFDVFLANGSQFPVYPATDTSTVTIGVMPGGTAVTGTLRRTRLPMANNLPSAGGTGTAVTNPTGTEAWQLQAYLTYQVSDRDYVKSRTVLRAR